MKQASQMLDVAEDILHDVEAADADLTPSRVARRNRVTAAVMRDLGFSDDEIIQKLGSLPEPFSDEGSMTEAKPAPAMAR